MKKIINERINNNGGNFSHSELFLNKLDNPLNNSNQLGAIFDHLPDATFAINLEGEVIAWNQAMEQMTGVPADEILGKGNYQYAISFYGNRRPLLIDLIFKDEAEIEKLNYSRIHKNGRELKAETIVKKNGGIKYLWGKASALLNEKGEIIGAIESVRDLTEHKLMEKSLKESKKRYQELFSHMASGVTVYQPTEDGEDFKVVDMNEAGFHITKTSREKIIGQELTVAFPGVKDMGLYDVIKKVAQTHQPEIHPISGYKDDELEVYVENYVYPLPSGEIVAIYNDITELKITEKKLKESKLLLDTLLDSPNDSIFLIDSSYNFITVNKATSQGFGLEKEELVGRNIEDILEPELYKSRKAYLGKVFKSNEPVEFEDQRNGVYYHNWIYPIKTDGLTDKAAVFSQDINIRKKNEQRVKHSEEKYRAIFEQSGTPLMFIEEDTTISMVNREFEKLSGFKKKEIEDKISFIEFVASPQEKKIMLDYHKLRRTGKKNVPDSYEFSLLTKDGQIKNILVKVSMVHGSSKSLAALIDITERKKAEIDLISAKEQFKSIFDHAPFGIYQSSPDGKIYEINKALADMLSYKSVKEFFKTINKSSLQEVVYVDSEERSRWVQEVSKDDKWHNFEILLRTKTNKIINVNLTSRSVRNSSGKVKYLEGFLEDISESKETLEKLHRSEERFRAVAESAVDGILTTNEDGKIIIFNDSLLNIFGYERSEILNQPVTLLIPERLQKNFQRRLNKFQSTGKHSLSGKTFLSTGLKKDGTEFPFEMSLSTWESDMGVYNTSIIRDVTERREAEEALRESESKFRSLVETTPEIIWEIDPNGLFTYISPQCFDVMGYNPDELIGNSINILAEDAYIANADEILNAPTTKRSPFEVQAKHKNGNELTIEIRSVILKDDNGRLTGFRGIARDITESKRAEKELIKANVYNRNLLETSIDPLLTIGLDGKINDVNIASEEITGFSRKELIGTDFSDYFKDPELARLGYQKVINDGFVKDYPLEIQNKNGHTTAVLYNASVFKDEIGEVSGVFAAARDVTNIKKAEEELRESQNKLKLAMDLAKLVHWEYDVKEDRFTFDDQFYQLYGTSSDEEGSATMSSEEYVRRFVPPEWSKVVAVETEKALITDDPDFKGYAEHPIIRADGEKRFLVVRFGVIKDEFGRTIKTYGANQDITERIIAEEKLKKSENKYYSLYSSMREGLAVHNMVYDSHGKAVDYILTDVNTAYENITGYKRADVIGKNGSELYGESELINLEICDSVAQGGEPAQFEIYNKEFDKYFGISVTSPGKGKFALLFEDITRRKKAEEEIKTSLKQKEILLQEIHHRVKNNLQIISSLLNLQESYVEDDEAVNVLRESQNRVISMAMIHEMLYDSEDLSTINFLGYIENLIYDLLNSYRINSTNVKLHLNIDEIHLNIETAVPCGLIISELVSNSLKYAFPKQSDDELDQGNIIQKEGNLYVSFHYNNEDQLELVIADDGVGLPEDFDFQKTDTLGLRLVSSLVGQLDGTIEIDLSRGTKFIIKFKELVYKKRI
jgi:PAS domain S-box-containing protein